MPDSKIDQTKSVLIVDDDPIQGQLIGDVCRRIGYGAVFAPSYEGAAEALKAGHFSHVTIDLALGERDGIELIRLLSELPEIPRVIVISGCDQRILNAAVRLAHAAGACDAISIPKPIELAALRKALTAPPCDCKAQRCEERPQPDLITADDLQDGFAKGEVFAMFQPKIMLANGRLVGCEALARWHSPTFGTVGPDRFIPLAEQAGLIKPLTLRMLREATNLTREILPRLPGFSTAVNFSATLLADPTIPEDVETILVESRVPGCSMMIEVTETTAMSDVAKAMDTLLRLRIKGLGISMDDFGTGYSSMSVLARMPFCELKIDRTFIKDCLVDQDLWKVVTSAVAIARAYNMKVVAEGIEDLETLAALDSIGRHIGQGYAIAKALPRQEFVQWCDGWDHRVRDGFLRVAERRQA
jgi:EAL domain-containing protein (putative c-di-GMP-specific phosphodiesterase class I)/CheY-like chemotaxis protein